MKLMKYALALAIAFCAITSVSNAQAFIGGGSSALALELGQAAVVAVGTAHANAFCLYTHHTSTLHAGSTVNAQDNRLGPAATTESGDFYIIWGPIGGNCANPDLASPFYMYTNLDSVLGDRGYFEVDPGVGGGCAAGAGYCQVLVLAAADTAPCPGTACPDNLLNVNPPAAPFNNMADNAAPPAALITAINSHHWNFAGTDIRPEDAKYATFRVLTACNAFINRQPFDQILRQTQGLGYSAGNTFTDDFAAGKSFHVKDFNISGNDPITGQPVPAFTDVPVGAQPIIIAVGPNPSPSGAGLALATDIPSFVAANFFSGVLVRATDLIGPTAPFAVTALVREPLSGTYNTFEYGAVNNSQFHTSQDINNCAPGGAPGNPLHIVSANGVGLEGGGVQGFRRRVIGTGQMVSTLQGSVEGGNQPSKTQIGYFFWSAANAHGLSNVKYLKYNGIDPLLATPYSTNGTLPASGGPGDPCANNIVNCPAGLITFAGLNSGDYALWSALRVVTTSPTPAGITGLISAAQTLNSTQTDFVTLSNLKVWRSHFQMPLINVNNQANGPNIAGGNDLCNPAVGALPEQGGDVGGAIILKQANADFCADFNNNTGLVNKTE
jgi:hypothetical protein